MMSAKRTEARERLLLATIEQIEAVGLERLTVRAITAAAGVNVAAVNYYFGSKGELVEAALKQALDHMTDDVADYAREIASHPAESADALFEYILAGARRYPRITAAHAHEMLEGRGPAAELPERLAPLVDAFTTAAVANGADADEATQRAAIAISACFFNAFFPTFLQRLSGKEADPRSLAIALSSMSTQPRSAVR